MSVEIPDEGILIQVTAPTNNIAKAVSALVLGAIQDGGFHDTQSFIVVDDGDEILTDVESDSGPSLLQAIQEANPSLFQTHVAVVTMTVSDEEDLSYESSAEFAERAAEEIDAN